MSAIFEQSRRFKEARSSFFQPTCSSRTRSSTSQQVFFKRTPAAVDTVIGLFFPGNIVALAMASDDGAA